MEAVISELKQSEQLKTLSKKDSKGLEKIKDDLKKYSKLNMFKNFIILILAFLVWLSYFSKSHSAEEHSQYCDIKITLIKTINEKGELVKEETEEKVVCNDGFKHILKN